MRSPTHEISGFKGLLGPRPFGDKTGQARGKVKYFQYAAERCSVVMTSILSFAGMVDYDDAAYGFTRRTRQLGAKHSRQLWWYPWARDTKFMHAYRTVKMGSPANIL